MCLYVHVRVCIYIYMNVYVCIIYVYVYLTNRCGKNKKVGHEPPRRVDDVLANVLTSTVYL